jgi:poly(A) polymerase
MNSTPSLAGQSWLHEAPLQRVFDAFPADTLRAVGGCVRDSLLGKPVQDIDLACALPPKEVLAQLKKAGIKAIPTGLAHGTITAVLDDRFYQITSLRIDVRTFGRRARVAFTDDWAADASRRDFTINALYANREGTLFDPLGGYGDLSAGIVRFIGHAETRIREDALRILRFFRFYAFYQPEAIPPDAASLDACTTLAPMVSSLSGERIHQEMAKLLLAPHLPHVLLLMQQARILKHTGLPDNLPDTTLLARLAEREKMHIGILQQHPWRRLYWLLSGDSDYLKTVTTRWRVDNNTRNRLLTLAETLPDFNPQDTLQRWQLIDRLSVDWYHDALLLASLPLPDSIALPMLAEHLPAAFALKGHVFPVSGNDVMQHFGLRGRDVGKKLEQLRNKWIASGFTLTREALLEG